MTSFVEHLQRACGQSPDYAVFLQGYEACLQGVREHGTFLVHGLTVQAPPGVYSPHETSSTRFLMDHFPALGLDRPFGSRRLLEVGCGAGAISMHAARAGWDVTATDIDPVAVEATVMNAAANGLPVEALQSDLFEQLEERGLFDAIIWNQPFFHVERPIEESERTLSTEGAELHERFLREARKHLAPGGYVVFAFANCSDVSRLHQPGWDLELRSFDYEAASRYIRAHFIARPTDLPAAAAAG